MNTFDTNHGPMKATDIVDYLTYCSYRHNRASMSAEDLKRFCFPVSGDEMEARYQAERDRAAA